MPPAIRLSLVACVAMCVAASLAAQSQTPAAFEVASIKPVVGEPPPGGGSGAPDRYEDPDTTLHFLIRVAYDLFDYQVVGGPEWMDSKRWAISAKAPAPMNRVQMRPLLRNLLADRFALKAHLETRELPTYELVMARSDKRLGPKIIPAAVDCTPFLTGKRPMAESPRDSQDRFPLCSSGASMGGGMITPRLNGQPLDGLLQVLEATLQRRVVNNTGLTGNYDIELTYVDERFQPQGADTAKGPALFTALEEQLGMKLQPARGPVEVLVVDSAREPTAN